MAYVARTGAGASSGVTHRRQIAGQFPDCTLLAYPIFAETASGNTQMPSATPEDLTAAILACIEAGARILNLSLALTPSSSKGERALGEALEYAARRGATPTRRRVASRG
jgi:hypothetical protein